MSEMSYLKRKHEDLNINSRTVLDMQGPHQKSGIVGTQPSFQNDYRLPPTDRNGCSTFRKNY